MRAFYWALTILTVQFFAGPLYSQDRISFGVPKEEADIVVGCLYPMSGRPGVLGKASVIGLQLALKYMEETSDQNWPKFHIVVGNTRSKRSTAINLADIMIDDLGVSVLCGVVNSSIAMEISSLAERRKTLFIGTDHATSRLTGDLLHSRYFRVSNDTRQSMTAGAMFTRDHFADLLEDRPLTISYMGPDYEYGYQVWADYLYALDQLGVSYEIEAVLWPRLNQPDYTPFIRHLSDVRSDLVVSSLWGGDMIAFMKQAVETDLFEVTQFANFEKGGDYEIFAALGDRMPTGLILSTRHHNNWPLTELNRWFVSQFYREAGYYPSSGASGAFTGLMAIAQAVQKAGSVDQAALIEALEGLSVITPEDPKGFSSFIDEATHQVMQISAIGITERNQAFPPAQVMLGSWRIYTPSDMQAVLER